MKRSGPKSAAQTPAPKSEKIYGSAKNPKGSAQSKVSGKSINFTDEIIKGLKNKVKEHNEKYPSDKVNLPTLKSVFRRGAGAYSSSHRPTITGGAPNSRNAWAFARVNKFLEKKAGKKVKAAYVQDDDLMANGGEINYDFKNTSIAISEKNKEPFDWFGTYGQDGKFYEKIKVPSKEINAWLYNVEDAQEKVDIGEFHGFYDIEGKGLDYYFDSKNYKKYQGSEHLIAILKCRISDDKKLYLLTMATKPSLRKKGIMSYLINEVRQKYNVKKEDVIFIGMTKQGEKFYKKNKYQHGGITNKQVVCQRCGWSWDTKDSDPSDKYVCHKCGHDNSWYYGNQASDFEKKKEGGHMDSQIALPDTTSTYENLKPILDTQGYILKKRGGDLPVGKLAKGMTLSEVAKLHGLKAEDLKSELKLGIETEMEHTDDPEIARAIAMDHLYEDEKYYTKLKKMEGVDKHMVEISKKYAQGGEIHEIYSFKTPTGEKSRLTYLQQVLVRTSGFKDFFGDWEMAAKSYLLDNKDNFEKHYKDVSKVVDMITLEPRVVYHGTSAEKEFYHFDVTKEVGVGRPYGYFAHNKEYSQNFTSFSQRTTRQTKPLLYEIFANVRNPFMAIGHQYEMKKRVAGEWETIITGTIAWDKYKTIDRSESKDIDRAVNSQIGKYLESIFSEPRTFWMAMANDREKDFKFFLMSYGYDGIFYSEEYQTPFDETNPAEYTKAVCIFDSKQVKLADGRNLNFNPLIDDIRYEEGGEVEDEIIDNSPEIAMHSKDKLAKLLFGGQFAEGGKVIADHKVDPNDGKKGGYFKGRSHADGGIKAINVDTGQLIEVEGEEVIITKGAVNDDTKREFEGEMLTNREILSRINQSGGGVAFEDGGEVSSCGCKGSKYKYGGEVMEDYMILIKMNEPFKMAQKNISQARSYVDDLVAKMK